MPLCIAILGGTFDPVHLGHIALARHFLEKLHPDELRIIPAGNPWQKEGHLTDAKHRMEMLQRAFKEERISVHFDRREIERSGPTYTIDTLRELRAELGNQVSIVLLLGADQMQRLDTWKEWSQIFAYAHICAASRPGYALDTSTISPSVSAEFSQRSGSLEEIRSTPCGFAYLSQDLSINISATDIRKALNRKQPRRNTMLPSTVLDYIEKFHLYRE